MIILIICLDKSKDYYQSQIIFTGFLALTLLVEMMGLLTIYVFKIPNAWLFNFFTAIEFLFYSYFIQKQLKSPLLKKITFIFIISYPLIFGLNILYFQPLMAGFHTYTFLLGSLWMILLSGFYLYEQFANEENWQKNLLLDPFFWVSTGLLFFYAGCFLLHGGLNYLIKNDRELAGQLYDINRILNILMYSLFAIGFACHRIFRKSLSL